MSIADFIRDTILKPRLKARGCLVVYDAEGRYRDLCASLASEKVEVVDTATSPLESRTEALQALRSLGKGHAGNGLEGIVVYVAGNPPKSDAAKQRDPFALYTVCGEVFPQDDADEYLNLCLRAKPDHGTAIRQLFSANASPSFAMLDAIGGGSSWPQLKALLGMESAREILFGLLAPAPQKETALKADNNWSQEARDLFAASLGVSLKTKGKSWSTLAEEMWRVLLFSEFVFDLPGELPASLAGVSRATQEAQTLVEYLCDWLRRDPQSRNRYVERAQAIEKELNLVDGCSAIQDLGKRDTFPFEERVFFQQAVAALKADNLDEVRAIVGHRSQSVWLSIGESQNQWSIVDAALRLIEQCDDYERLLPEHVRTQAALLDFYTGSLREVDRLHREFEQAVADVMLESGPMAEVIQQARTRYRKLVEQVQSVFMRHLETSGWPPQGRLANADTFNKFVAPVLGQAGQRVAYLMVDALRYELGMALERLLAEDAPVTLHAAYAQLPTITSVGMASLLPDAAESLFLADEANGMVPKIGDVPVANVTQRMDFMRKRLGARFAEMRLNDFVLSKDKVQESVDLLVLRSVEIDSQLENDPQETIGLLPKTLSRIRAAVNKLREQGFKQVVIAADHGFYLNAAAVAGDVCAKPSGDWRFVAHDRILLGQGIADDHNLVMSADKLHIRGGYPIAAMPKSLAPYSRGLLYFHGGASLQEALVPVLSIKLEKATPEPRNIEILLSYRNGAKHITTRMPVVEVLWATNDMFEQDRTLEILLEAQTTKGEVVGEARGNAVDLATGVIVLRPNERVPVPLRMADEYEGKFVVKALNPTTLVAYQSINLETDYTV
jgi:hypothetical protein